jgi:hypothetical protein
MEPCHPYHESKFFQLNYVDSRLPGIEPITLTFQKMQIMGYSVVDILWYLSTNPAQPIVL